MKEINPNFFYAINFDEDYKFRNARCRTLYEYYYDEVSFDRTYSINRHGLPCISFVGIFKNVGCYNVKHHGKSTLLGCALLGNEEIPSYEWVFTQ
ncbi:hypothetical protein Ahy_A07g034265 [Arachis hypogaea]|uniref:Protein FAR1-RELATED SEQUENCE n=1 Tax=Arachis hypogaea TaxID=3818 RepID=A0A445CBD1_ARAHY|nr:hypothetical protein Ahy_A07g034265 [Arachis hypogaea]